jgi:uncharacterized protein YdiU (UPF0061 family)
MTWFMDNQSHTEESLSIWQRYLVQDIVYAFPRLIFEFVKPGESESKNIHILKNKCLYKDRWFKVLICVILGLTIAHSCAAWFIEVAERTASLVAKWQGVGFTHGVLNTDNMSVLGLTIDYGPFGFLDAFDPKYTPNTTDLPGRRYCFANQPDIGLWNLMQFATTLTEGKLITEEEAQFGLDRCVLDWLFMYNLHTLVLKSK